MNRERDYAGSMDVAFFLTAEQSAIWYAWWKDTLIEGGRSFNANWPALRPGFLVLQFTTEPVFTHVYNGAHRVSATVQVRGASREVYTCIGDPYHTGPTGDPYWSTLGCLISGVGTINQTAITSAAPHTLTLTAAGAAKIAADPSVTNGTALYLPDTSSGWSAPNTEGMRFRTGDFSIEFDLWIDAGSPSADFLLLSCRDVSGSNRWYVALNSSRRLTFGVDSGSLVTSTTDLPVASWCRFVIARTGTTLSLIQAGVSKATASNSTDFNNTASSFRIGDDPSLTGFLPAYLKNIRISRGVGRHTGNYLWPSLTSAYETTVEAPNTAASLSQGSVSSGGTQSKPTALTHRLVTTTAFGSNWSVGWAVTADLFGKRYIEFVNEGPGDAQASTGRGVAVGFIYRASSPPLNPTSTGLPNFLATNLNYSGGSPGYFLNGGALTSNGAYDFVQNDVIGMAIDHATGKLWMRKNGGAWIGGGDPVLGTTPTATLTTGWVMPAVYFYARGSTGPFAGDHQVRIRFDGDSLHDQAPTGYTTYKGQWVEPPKTILSLHFDGNHGSTVFTDSSRYNRTVARSYGAAAISTVWAKHGPSSLYGGAVATELLLSQNSEEFTAPEWSWSGWYNRQADGNYHAFMYANNSNLIVFLKAPNNSGTYQLGFTLNSSNAGNTISSTVIGTPAHLAMSVSKLGSTYTWRLFFNGVLEATGTTTDANMGLYMTSQNISIGRSNSGGFAGLNGYLDEYHLVSGCLWTADFTPPAYPYCDQNADA